MRAVPQVSDGGGFAKALADGLKINMERDNKNR
jgi:hypothetical protein